MAKREALLIGTSKYKDVRLGELKTPEADVLGLAEILRDPKIGAFDNVSTLINEPSEVLRKELARFVQAKNRDDLLLIYFSGHGLLDDQGLLFFGTSDTDVEMLSVSSIPANFVIEQMSRSRSTRQVLIIDSDHSGAVVNNIQRGFERSPSDLIILASSSASEFNAESTDGDRYSLFTHLLISGLKTGEADLNRDAVITDDELYDYVHTRIANIPLAQKPQKWSFRVQAEIIIAYARLTPDAIKADVSDTINVVESSADLVKEQRIDTPTQSIQFQKIGIAIRALADKPSEVDWLRFSDYADALCKFIKSDKTEKPIAIAIDASWGMGKTTLMKLMKDSLASTSSLQSGKSQFPIVWFNAWKYEEEESLWAALVLEILRQVRQQLSWHQKLRLFLDLNRQRIDWGELVRRTLKYFLIYILLAFVGALVLLALALIQGRMASGSFITFEMGVWTRIQKYASFAGILTILPAIFAASKQFFDNFPTSLDAKVSNYVREPNYKERVGFLHSFEEDFTHVTYAVTQNGKWPLIIFIDDLDRCSPPKPAEIIEAINILLDAKHCVFILGMDSQAVAGSIEAKYKDLLPYLNDVDGESKLSLGQRFLEKIIQINFHIPRPDPEIIKDFVERSLSSYEANLNQGTGERQTAKEQIQAYQRGGMSLEKATQTYKQEHPETNAHIVEQASLDIEEESFDNSDAVREAIQYAVPYLYYNPRKIKRFINLFRLQALIANQRGLLEKNVIELSKLSKWLIISTRWPEVVEIILENKEFVDNLRTARSKSSEYDKFLNDESFPHVTPEQQNGLKAQLDYCLTDINVKRFFADDDLMTLLSEVDLSPVVLGQYLHLAQLNLDRRSRVET